MFVRFRRQGNRFQPSLMQTRRVSGKICNEHIASLGSVDADVSVRERLVFWAKLPERLARLGNRVGSDDHAKIYGALHARIPMVTPDEQRAIQGENAKDDERFWDSMHDMNASMVEGHKALIAAAEAKIAEVAPMVAQSAERHEAARDRLNKIRRVETVAGGLGKRVDLRAMLKGMLTPDQFRRVELWARASVTEAEFETVLERTLQEQSRCEGQGPGARASPDHTGAEIGPRRRRLASAAVRAICAVGRTVADPQAAACFPHASPRPFLGSAFRLKH